MANAESKPERALGRDLVRDELVHASRTWVVKVGTNVLTDRAGALDIGRIRDLADQVSRVLDTGRRVALVSSGAVGAGIGELGLACRPDTMPQVQAAAAVGQAYLIRAYDECLRTHGRRAGQLLLTHDDFDHRSRYLNMRNTLSALFEWRAVPVINENDTISTSEIRFGDNDRLAAMVANLLRAELLVILSVVDGLFSADPAGPTPALPVPLVAQLDDSIIAMAGASKSPLGSGGMKSKLEAAGLVTRAGGSVIITSGLRDRPLDGILAGEPIGTLFLGKGEEQAARKRWIGLTARPKGEIRVDVGARQALVEGAKSLLPVGVVAVVGGFEKGEVVSIADPQGVEFARGLTNFAAADARRIAGLKTEQARAVLGPSAYAEIVHKDNLVLLD